MRIEFINLFQFAELLHGTKMLYEIKDFIITTMKNIGVIQIEKHENSS